MNAADQRSAAVALLSGILSHEQDLKFAPENWDTFVQCAAEELVLPALYECMCERDIAEMIPKDEFAVLAAVRDLNLERNEGILSELTFAVSLLNQHGIEPVALKGVAYILRDVYESASQRYMRDIDLLLPSEELAVAVEILRRAGYSADGSTPVAYDCHHYRSLRRPGGVGIELHHSLAMGAGRAVLTGAEVIAGSLILPFNGARLRIPSAEHLIVHHVVHSQIASTYRESVWPTLRDVRDLVLLERRFRGEFDWTEIKKFFERKKYAAVLPLYFDAVVEALRWEAPIDFELGRVGRLRRLRRSALRRRPRLRFIDPVYLLRSVFVPRLSRVRDLIRDRQGIQYLLMTPLRRSFYSHLVRDIG